MVVSSANQEHLRREGYVAWMKHIGIDAFIGVAAALRIANRDFGMLHYQITIEP